METLKVKSVFFSLLAIIAMSVLMTSCEQNVVEDLSPVTENEVQERNFLMSALATQIVGKWWHSHEEDVYPITENIYRPDSYTFPISRGRRGFEFLANRTFVYHYNSPTDQPVTATGRWRAFTNARITLVFDQPLNSQGRVRVINVNSFDANSLVFQRLDWY